MRMWESQRVGASSKELPISWLRGLLPAASQVSRIYCRSCRFGCVRGIVRAGSCLRLTLAKYQESSDFRGSVSILAKQQSFRTRAHGDNELLQVTRGVYMTYNTSRLLQELDDHLRRQPRLPLSALEEQLGVGRHTIEKVIRTATGKSFRQYQSQKVLAEAKRMLSGSDLFQIKQVALSLGYSSTKSFSSRLLKNYS